MKVSVFCIYLLGALLSISAPYLGSFHFNNTARTALKPFVRGLQTGQERYDPMPSWLFKSCTGALPVPLDVVACRVVRPALTNASSLCWRFNCLIWIGKAQAPI
jgi:hypothetical protein